MLTENYQISETQQNRLVINSNVDKIRSPIKPVNISIRTSVHNAVRSVFRRFIITAAMVIFQISTGHGFAGIVSFTASSGNSSDETIIRIHEDATNNFDGDWDAYKLSNSGNTPNFYTVINSAKYAINSIPGTFEELNISLNLEAAFTGHYIISVKNINNSYDNSYTIMLEDKLLNSSRIVLQNSIYEFDATASDSINRFVLHYKKISADINEAYPIVNYLVSSGANEKVTFDVNGDRAYIDFNNTQSEFAAIGIINGDGKVVYSDDNIATKSAIEISLFDFSSGTIYIARIIVGNEVVYKKFTVIK